MEVGADDPVTDRSSRPIVVTEGVIVAGQVAGDPEVVLRAARSQFTGVIQDYWNNSDEFRTPRFSEPVACRLTPTVAARDPAVEGPTPVPSSPEDANVPGPNEPPRTRPVVATGAPPPVRPPRRRRVLPVLLVLLMIAAVVVLVAVVLLG